MFSANFLFWKTSHYRDKNLKSFICYLVIIQVIHPSIINSMIESMTCIDIDDEYRMKKDFYYHCYNTSHIAKVNNILKK